MRKSIFTQYSYLFFYIIKRGKSVKNNYNKWKCKNLYFHFLTLIFSFISVLRAPSVSLCMRSFVTNTECQFSKRAPNHFDNCWEMMKIIQIVFIQRCLEKCLYVCILLLTSAILFAQPANDNCSNAAIINIPNSGFGMGKFNSSTNNITQATLQTGESFAPVYIMSRYLLMKKQMVLYILNCRFRIPLAQFMIIRVIPMSLVF